MRREENSPFGNWERCSYLCIVLTSKCTESWVRFGVSELIPSVTGVSLFYAIRLWCILLWSTCKIMRWRSDDRFEKKKQHLGQSPDSPAISTKAAGWIMQEPYSPLCLILHCFCRENFCLPSKSCHLRLSSRLSNHQNGIKCCKAAQQENFQKSEPICRAALVENVFCSRQNFPSVLSTEKFTDFSQWNLLEFIGSWLAVTD